MWNKKKIEDDKWYYCQVKQAFPIEKTNLVENSIILAHARIAQLWLDADAVKVERALKPVDASAEIAKLDTGKIKRPLTIRIRVIQSFVDRVGRLFQAGQVMEIWKNDAITEAIAAGLLVVEGAGKIQPPHEATAAEIEVARNQRLSREFFEPPPLREAEPSFDWDSIPGEWVKMKVTERMTDHNGRKYVPGETASFSKMTAKAMLEKKVGEVIGEGSEPQPQLSKGQKLDRKFDALQSELDALRREQDQTQRSITNVSLLLHPTGTEDNRIRPKKTSDSR